MSDNVSLAFKDREGWRRWLEENHVREKEAWVIIQRFSNSVKLMYVYWVEEAKKEETRTGRIMEVVARAAKNIKPT